MQLVVKKNSLHSFSKSKIIRDMPSIGLRKIERIRKTIAHMPFFFCSKTKPKSNIMRASKFVCPMPMVNFVGKDKKTSDVVVRKKIRETRFLSKTKQK